MFGRKIAVIAASLMLTLSMSAVAFAGQDAPTTTNATNPANGSVLVIEKNLKVTNPTLTSVYGPGLTYNYAVAPETPSADNGGATITDAQNHTGTVHIGPAGGITLSAASMSWPKGTAVTASATGADNKKSINATANISSFTAPGIYRYKVTESADPADPSTIGVTDANAAEVRYIDVYIVNGNDGLEVSGVVMHDGGTAQTNKKTFDDSQFDTKNVEVKKVVAGNMADKNHEFPFAATVSDNGRKYFDGKGATAAAATNENATGSSSANLKDGESFWICGVSKVGTVAVTETNNTADTYKTNVSGMATVAQTDVAPNGTLASGTVTVTDNGQILFTNTLDRVSPTGVIMRFGPYIGMVLAALVFALIFRRTRQSNNA